LPRNVADGLFTNHQKSTNDLSSDPSDKILPVPRGADSSHVSLYALRGKRLASDLSFKRRTGSDSSFQFPPADENQKLTQQVQRLRYHKEEVEKIAREELGLVKKGEIIYQFER